jgi:EAL domain-containing protein (putative c-di-GMP-specific phosphodiesterase class I)/CheY-like chemotaxis protein
MTEMAASSLPLAADAAVAAPLAPAKAPLCYVVDEEASIRHFLSLVLHGSGVDTMEFADGAAMRRALEQRVPDLVFHNIPLDSADAVESMVALGRSALACSVQLMSNRGAAVLEHVKNIGTQQQISMLPVLKKPFETSAIQKVMSELKLGHGPATAGVKVSLAEALKNNWVEFWYQPKIDLRRKQLAGAEAFARVCHPRHGVLTPGSFMPDADDASVLALAERALVSALKSGLNLSKFGVNLRIAINVPVACLVKLPVGQIVREHRPQVDDWPGLMIDVSEAQIVSEITLANELNKKFAEHNVRLAIDDFGKGYASLTKLKELPFAEMKLDRSFVVGCGTDKVHAPICKTVIDLAHSFGSLAVGIGLERASDAMALVSMGCDLGQGFLFGQPMPEQRFIALLKQRVTVRPAAAPAQTAPALQPA